jgi:hypothetical protein
MDCFHNKAVRQREAIQTVVAAKAGIDCSAPKTVAKMLGWTAPDGIDSARL